MTTRSFDAVVIGASAGGLSALTAVLSALPTSFSLPVMVVLHLPADKKNVAAELLQTKCRLVVKEAEDKEPFYGGTVYFAPPDYHLLVEPDKRLSLSSEEPVLFSRPSIDVLFETAADAFGSGVIGIVLSGANSDGANGLRAIMDAGGIGLVQEPEQAYALTMPRAALNLCPGALSLALGDIATYLQEVVSS